MPLDYLPERKRCLLVDNDNDQVDDYSALLTQLDLYSVLVHVPQDRAADEVRRHAYDAVVIDNDGFRIGEYPGFRTAKTLIDIMRPEKIVYVTSWPNTQDLQADLRSLGVQFCNKGKWRQLEQFISGCFYNAQGKNESRIDPQLHQ